MKIKPKDQNKFLEGDFRNFNAILFYGPNLGLIRENIDKICENFCCDEEGTNKVVLRCSDMSREPSLLMNELSSLDLFSAKKVVVVEDVTGAISKELKEILLNQSNTDVVVIFHGALLSPSDSVRKFFESSEKLVAFPCYMEELASIRNKVSGELKARKIHVEDPSLIDYIADNIGGDTSLITKELKKLISVCEVGGSLSSEIARSIMSKSLHDADFDKLIGYVMEGKHSLAEVEFEKLILSGVKVSSVIRSFLRYFIRLYVAHGLVQGGVHVSQVGSRLKPPVFFKQVPVFQEALSKYSFTKTVDIMGRLLQLEIQTKTYNVNLARVLCERELFAMFVLDKCT